MIILTLYISETKACEFTGNVQEWGYNKFLPWSTLVNPENGYAVEDSIILEVDFKVDHPEGIDFNQPQEATPSSLDKKFMNMKLEDSSFSLAAPDLCSKVSLWDKEEAGECGGDFSPVVTSLILTKMVY